MAKRGNAEGSIYKRTDGRWAGAITVAGGGRKYFYSKTRREVAAKVRGGLDAEAKGLPASNDRERVDTWLTHWLEDIATPNLRPKTIASYGAIVRRHLIPTLGHIGLSRLTPDDVERYCANKAAAGLAPKTVRHHHSVLRRALREAERRGLIQRNVARLVTPPKPPRYEVRALTPRDARAILAATREDRLSALYSLALGLGLRQGEALGLHWNDIDLVNGSVSVRYTLQRYDGAYHLGEPKTERSRRTLAMPTPLTEALRRHRVRQAEEQLAAGPSWQGGDWGLAFANELGAPLSGIQVTRRFQRLLAEACLPRMRFHDLRHGAATVLLALGVDLRTIMETLGHSQIGVTMDVYAGVIPELKRDAADRVGAALWGSA